MIPCDILWYVLNSANSEYCIQLFVATSSCCRESNDYLPFLRSVMRLTYCILKDVFHHETPSVCSLLLILTHLHHLNIIARWQSGRLSDSLSHMGCCLTRGSTSLEPVASSNPWSIRFASNHGCQDPLRSLFKSVSVGLECFSLALDLNIKIVQGWVSTEEATSLQLFNFVLCKSCNRSFLVILILLADYLNPRLCMDQPPKSCSPNRTG